MPNLLDCARVHATEGEIVEALQTVFGTYTETPSSSSPPKEGPMRKLFASVLVLAALGIVASQAFAATRSVSVGDDWFVAKGHPRSITVKKGTTVTWHFRGKTMHNVDAAQGPRATSSRATRRRARSRRS